MATPKAPETRGDEGGGGDNGTTDTTPKLDGPLDKEGPGEEETLIEGLEGGDTTGETERLEVTPGKPTQE